MSGEIDLATCAAFRFALDDACALGQRSIALDFGRVAFLGSNGIREIIRILHSLDRLEIREPTVAVRRVLELSGLGSRVVIVD